MGLSPDLRTAGSHKLPHATEAAWLPMLEPWWHSCREEEGAGRRGQGGASASLSGADHGRRGNRRGPPDLRDTRSHTAPALPYAGEVVRLQCSSDGGVEGGREEGQGQGGAEVQRWRRGEESTKREGQRRGAGSGQGCRGRIFLFFLAFFENFLQICP